MVDINRLQAAVEELRLQGAITAWAVSEGPNHVIPGVEARPEQVVLMLPSAAEVEANRAALAEFGDQLVIVVGRLTPN